MTRYNSSLILHYCLISPHVLRPMIHMLKLWASAYDLNDASGQNGAPSFSSYCLTLMAIANMQDMGLLPNLQESVKATIPEDPAQLEPNAVWVAFGKSQGVKAHIAFDKEPPPGWTPSIPDIAVDNVIRNFFVFLNPNKRRPGFGFDSQTEIVSVLQGGFVKRPHKMGYQERVLLAQVAEMEELGYTPEVIAAKLAEYRETNDNNVGKGDQGTHPIKWDREPLVVQDPLIWQKVSAYLSEVKDSADPPELCRWREPC